MAGYINATCHRGCTVPDRADTEPTLICLKKFFIKQRNIHKNGGNGQTNLFMFLVCTTHIRIKIRDCTHQT